MSISKSGEFKFTNRLVQEKSPYLLQHAHNPVDWYPWGEAAFERAKKENKVIFLSIGYSTCHWCHVMERESFENAAVAQILNTHFVCIKVDREERPDVDQIYMNAVMLLTGQGGWPLNIFLTPELQPFYGGTYFPPDGRYGRPGFPAVLEDVARTWEAKPEDIRKGSERLAGYMAGSHTDYSGGVLDQGVLNRVKTYALNSFDRKDGGFRSAPKFPPSLLLSLLMRLQNQNPDPDLLTSIEVTLDKMAQGGIYDQLGGGFSRYSTDDQWLVPHFEKMLYDNALLSKTYLEAYQVTGKQEYARIAGEIFNYYFRDMMDSQGGFYSAEDADSEGHEGKFYVWNPDEIKSILGQEEGSVFCQLYGVTEQGQFEQGQSILHLQADLSASLEALGKDLAWWKSAVERILAVRAKRIRPHLDDKILTAWNSLMISSLAYGYQVLGDERYLAAAEKTSSFIVKHLFEEGRLMASYRQGPSDIQGYIDDYAFFLAAQLDLFESTFNLEYLRKAMDIEKEMTRLFWDKKDGAYYFNGSDQKDQNRLLTRAKEAYDGVIPSGNSMAALSLYRLSELTANKAYRDRADSILKCFSGDLAKNGSNFPMMLQAFQFDFRGIAEVFVTGPRLESRALIQRLQKSFVPNKILVYAEEKDIPSMAQIIPWVEGRQSQEGKPTLYVCKNYQCQLPTTNVEKALELLKS